MKKYDYLKAKRIIEEKQKLGFTRASLGMKEDWWWTGVDVWEVRSGFLVDLTDPKLELAGICGSHWATPALCLSKPETGSEVYVECSITEGERMEKPACMGVGIFSQPRQEKVDAKKLVAEELL